MKQVMMAILLVASLCSAQDSGDFQPATTNVWGAQYPRVDGAGQVEIRIKAPDATKVRLNFWSGPKEDMVKQVDGFWTFTTPPLAPGLHYYTLILDGAEVTDLGSHAFFGGGRHASAVEVPEPGADYYAIRAVPHGHRFALSHPGVDVCMMGGRSADQVRENLRALDLGPLGADEMSRVRRIGDHLYGKPRARPGEPQAKSSR